MSDTARELAEGKADLLARVAHDLRSPLGVVSEVLAALRSDFEPQLTEEHRMLTSLAERGVRRLGRLADVLSLVAAMETGALELQRGPGELGALVREAAREASALEPRREVNLTVEVSDGPIRVHVDAQRMVQAVTEILINAIRHAKTRVRVSVERLREEAMARVVVEDDGQGIPEPQRPVFVRRYAPRPARSGLGLGLSVAHDVLEAHGGSLALESSTLPPARPSMVGARVVMSISVAA